MNKSKIIEQYAKYCYDKNIDYKKTTSKKAFLSDYIIINAQIYGIKTITQNNIDFIKNTLKHSNAEILKELQNEIAINNYILREKKILEG